MHFDEYLQWEAAEEFCNALGGHLPWFHTQSQMNRFIDYMENESGQYNPWSNHEGVWLGGNDLANEVPCPGPDARTHSV